MQYYVYLHCFQLFAVGAFEKKNKDLLSHFLVQQEKKKKTPCVEFLSFARLHFFLGCVWWWGDY